jgi:nitrogenase molybdenum-iron protein beta chain
MILSGLFENFVTPDASGAEKQPGTINIFGIVPGQDAFYKGNLTEIKRLLVKLGLRVNTFFGEGETLENLRGAGQAVLNIVLSDLYGKAPAKDFERTHGTPYICLPMPIGAAQTAGFIRAVAKAVNMDGAEAVAEAVILEEESRYYDYIERLADIYNDVDLQRYVVVVGDVNYAPAVSRFVADELGWLPKLAVVTDFTDDALQTEIAGRFAGWENAEAPRVRFDTDTSAVRRYMREIWPPGQNQRYTDSFTPAVIIGSAFERDLSAEFSMPLLTVSFPVTNRAVLHQAYAGYNGGLNLTADLLTALVAGR